MKDHALFIIDNWQTKVTHLMVTLLAKLCLDAFSFSPISLDRSLHLLRQHGCHSPPIVFLTILSSS